MAVGGVFGINELAVGLHVEDAFAALDECGFHAEGFPDLGRRTGGLGEVVSHAAVFDGDVHGSLAGMVKHCGGDARRGALRLFSVSGN